MAQVNNTTADVMIPESWTRDVEFARDDNLVFADLVTRKYEQDLNVGDQVHIPFVGNLTVENITSGSNLTPIANTETEVVLVVDKFKGVAVEIFDKTKIQSKYDLPAAYKNRIGQALADVVDSDIAALWSTVAAGNQMTAVANVDYDDIVDAVTLLDMANVPQDGRSMVVDSRTLGDLRKDDNFIRYDSTGKAGAWTQGDKAIGEIYGIKVYISNNVAIDTTETPDEIKNMIFHKSAFALAMQKSPWMEMHRNPLGSADYIIGRELYGVKTIRTDHAVVLPRQV